MKERENLTGQSFGRWTVLGECTLDEGQRRRWLCRCACGTERFVREDSLLHSASQSCGCLTRENRAKARARATHGPERSVHREQRKYTDITGQSFHRLTALYPTDKRCKNGSVVWLCRCECGKEAEYSYNELLYSNVRSCGCRKKETAALLPERLTHVDGTTIDRIKSSKVPWNNTTGYKGVYLVKGRYQAKIVFQKKAYYLGCYSGIEAAVEARKEAEELLFRGTAEYYVRWKALAELDPQWAAENPVSIRVFRDQGRLNVEYSPAI